uniref:Ig-like domain-containing protein n=1 Tax=Pundamilia nyererei TaxID=303518 RepID=A0A3B4FW09_9CICH
RQWSVFLCGTDGSDVQQTPILGERMGGSATMYCNHTKGDVYFQMCWYRQLPGQTLELIVTHTYESGFSEEKFPATKTNEQTGSLTVEKLLHINDSSTYYLFCTVTNNYPAYFGQGTKLTVLENSKITPPQVKILEPSKHEYKKRKKTLVCVASGFYPDHVKVYWQMNGKNVTDGVATDEAAREGKDDNNQTVYKITSRLRVYAKQWENPDNIFKCVVNFFSGTVHKDYSDVIAGVTGKFLWNLIVLLLYAHIICKSFNISVICCELIISSFFQTAETNSVSRGKYYRLFLQ